MKKIYHDSTSFWKCPSPTKNRLKKNAISCIVVEILVPAISSPDSRWRRFLSETAARKPCRSRIGALLPSTCHLALPTRPSLCTFARSSQFWVANHDRLDLWENDREYLCNVNLESRLSCSIYSMRSKPHGTLFVLRSCHVEHHE